jgi:small subunit ribosomal protein S8
MSLNDPLANVLSFIKNYERLGRTDLLTTNNSKVIRIILSILQEEGYIGSYEEVDDGKGKVIKINLLGKINKIGVIKPRFAIKKDNFEKFEKRFLPARGFGIIILSTSQGIMTNAKAKAKGIGGKLLCYCY